MINENPIRWEKWEIKNIKFGMIIDETKKNYQFVIIAEKVLIENILLNIYIHTLPYK